MWSKKFVYDLNHFKIFNVVHKNNPRAHSPQQNKKALLTTFVFFKAYTLYGRRDSKKWVFPVYNRKSEHHNWILQIRISLGTKFQLKLKILIFWISFTQKRKFRLETKKVNIIIEFCISNLVYVPNFSLNWQFWFSGPSLTKKGICGWKLKKLHLSVRPWSLLTILDFFSWGLTYTTIF